MLNKENYLAVNRVAFSNLSKKEKDEKYKIYVNKYKLRNDNSKTVKTTVRQRNNNNNNRRNSYTQAKWSECLLTYAKASVDPFDDNTLMPCIPDTLCAPSHKFNAMIDTIVTVGTLGVGFVLYNPWAMCGSNGNVTTTYNDRPLVVTLEAFNQNAIAWDLDQDPPHLDFINSNSPYAHSQFTGGSDGGTMRLVAAGVEIEYTGQLLNQAGTISIIQWDGLNSIPNPTSVSSFKSNTRTQTCAVSREARCYVRYEPIRQEDFSYSSLYDYLPSQNANNGIAVDGIYAPMVILISGAEPGTTFRVKAIAYFEAQVRNLPVTPSESDPIGFAALQAARTVINASQEPKRDLWDILKQTAINVGKMVTGFGPQIGAALGAALGNPVLGTAVGSASKSIFESLFG